MQPGRFATAERIVHALNNWILDRLLAPVAPVAPTVHPLQRACRSRADC
jgi:choline monooxygenase